MGETAMTGFLRAGDHRAPKRADQRAGAVKGRVLGDMFAGGHRVGNIEFVAPSRGADHHAAIGGPSAGREA
jgi:hypothetical protein